MEERKKNLCAMIPESLHKKVREEQEEWGIKLNEYMERILKDHFEKGEREMANGTRTLAFQVSEEFFQRLKKYLKKTGQSQKECTFAGRTCSIWRDAGDRGKGRT